MCPGVVVVTQEIPEQEAVVEAKNKWDNMIAHRLGGGFDVQNKNTKIVLPLVACLNGEWRKAMPPCIRVSRMHLVQYMHAFVSPCLMYAYIVE